MQFMIGELSFLSRVHRLLYISHSSSTVFEYIQNHSFLPAALDSVLSSMFPFSSSGSWLPKRWHSFTLGKCRPQWSHPGSPHLLPSRIKSWTHIGLWSKPLLQNLWYLHKLCRKMRSNANLSYTLFLINKQQEVMSYP